MGMSCIFDAFSAEAVVHRRDHPCRHKHCDELDIPYHLEVSWNELLSYTSDLSINDSGVPHPSYTGIEGKGTSSFLHVLKGMLVSRTIPWP